MKHRAVSSLAANLLLCHLQRMNIAHVIPRPGSSALRKGRFSAKNHIYHVTACTANRKPFFQNLGPARAVVQELRHGNTAGRSTTLAFVVMPDHVHWLVCLASTTSHSRVVNLMKSFSAHRVNRLLSRSGPVWQRGFHDHGIRTEEEMIAIARYIVANPLRAGLVDWLGDYPHWDSVWL